MAFIDKLALILVRERRQLVARTAGKTAFFTPGGKREGDVRAPCTPPHGPHPPPHTHTHTRTATTTAAAAAAIPSHRPAQETDHAALIRECKEELTVDLRPASIEPYGVFQAQAFGKPQGVMVRMTCFTASFDGQLAPSEGIEELKWITSDFDPELLTVTGRMILADLKEKGLVD